MKKQRRLSFLLKISLLTAGTILTATAQQIPEEGPHVRIMKNSDGSSTQFKRDHTNTRLEQSSFMEKANGEKIVRTRTVYRRDLNGRLRSGIIEDGKKNILYRIIYGYDKNTGFLIAENMFDARVIRKNDPIDPNKETPVRALRYSYNAQGQRSKPIVYVGVKGKTAKELQKWIEKNNYQEGTMPIDDPFRNNTVNPNARPLKQR